jgi:hypothetical protein
MLGAFAASGAPELAVDEAAAPVADEVAAPVADEAAAPVADEAAGEAAPAPAAAAPAEPQTYQGRGVYYFEGSVESPLAGLGSRAAHASNRLALDDQHSVVTVDRARHRILVRNTHSYETSALVGCLVLLGRGTTSSGEEVPLGVHLVIHKSGDYFNARLHPHPTVRDEITSAVFDPFEVVLFNGKKEEAALTLEQAIEAVRDPASTARLADIFLKVTDRLEGVAPTPERRDTPLVDLSIGFSTGGPDVTVARIKLLSKSADNAPLIRRGALRELLERGEWELRIGSKSARFPKRELARNFFLFGIDDLPVFDTVKDRGLRYGQTLVMGFQDGKGYVGVGEDRAELANPVELARAFMEFHFAGGVVARQVTQLPDRIE